MASLANEDRKELKLDHRHLAFFFLGAAVVCAVFFVLGFLVGRGQTYEVSLKAQAEATEKGLDQNLSGESRAGEHFSSHSASNNAAQSPSMMPSPSTEKDGKSEPLDYHKELDFYSAVKEQKVKENFHPDLTSERNAGSAAGKTVATSSPSNASSPVPSKSASEKLVSLQVAALKQPREAENLARTLRAKGYAVFLVRPDSDSADKLIRVQVGPFKESAEVSAVKARLEKDGFKTIMKR